MNYSYIKVPSPIQDVLSNQTLIIMADKFIVNITVRAHGASRRSNVKPERETRRREKARRVDKLFAPREEDTMTEETQSDVDIRHVKDEGGTTRKENPLSRRQREIIKRLPRVEDYMIAIPPQEAFFNSLDEDVKSRIHIESIHNIDDYLEAVKAAVSEIKAEEKAQTKTDSKLKRVCKTIKKKVTGAWDSVFGGKKGNCNPKNDSV